MTEHVDYDPERFIAPVSLQAAAEAVAEVTNLIKSCGAIGAFAECKDCGAVFDNYKNAQALAAKHAKKYGHTVSGESTMHFTYSGDVVG